ncbi:MAG: S9 family peptidase [Mesorhizobium sp.]|uniref:S9 family peptidase n=1 Tax=unclassified Mesorhizobium TaxID=325217 RepID=UPI000F7572B9|nr:MULTISPECIES: S9 family peptidase [unclassified Mesorhizobium]AZO48320.1 S9 family peptidase [Mesorhizobium sp. M4B.F.Ca.ET.058.02.1.1]RUX47341.1 S9 family peptidase [Mesorhizobium sp. M4A.F.Ca.ET.050.02.1.1]RVC43741.1 S9 family peptidase [Mesorhizobium sp. M4A.F.Ca.ET.090.04.2.1]RVC78269.1 S9 family peptidase [Mesorhizobium sp. M4A.F.Ca.ET.022.05.2.1]RVD44572.1 S9 family peptidase [Mesorhizobium sp. M4A.F.Ca.ET.020.02.1.1]
MTRSPAFSTASPPQTEKRPVFDTHHGFTRTDDYAWLRADNWQAMFRDPSLLDGRIRAHLEAENAYQAELMADTAALRKQLFAEMKGRIKEDDSTVPMKDGPYAYGSSYRLGGEQPRYFRTQREGGEEKILLDGDVEAGGKPYFRLGGVDHSADHGKLLWAFDDKGSEFFTLRVRDLGNGQELADQIPDTGGGGVWNAGDDGFFYTRLDDNHRPSKVLFHALGDNAENDRLIYEETDPGFFMDVGGTRSKEWIMIGINDHETSEYRLLRADDPRAEPKLVAARETGLQYDLEEGGDIFFILTNADGAKDFKVMTAPANAPARANWRELVPHEPGRLILSVLGFNNYMVRLERKEGLPRIVVRDRESGEEHLIFFDEEAFSLGLSGSYEYDTETMRFTYSSMTTPAQVFDYNMRTRERVLLKTQEVPSGHEPDHYVTRRLMAPAADGELVPISLIHHRDTPLDGSAPCLLYGYGSYGITVPASFNTNCLSLVDRGFVYAIAHVRGGKDKGYGWYDDGKRAQKINTFTDFIACARHLVAERYTGHDRIVAQGGSAGGMLMGAIANLAPECFGGIVAEVPFVDVLTTMLDATLPLTPPEWPEWGNPIASAEDYRTIAAYSPYDNVAALDYPPILAQAGLTDPRVTYWEPAKWVARLRERKRGDNPVLFKINMESGHAGASGRFSRLEEIAYTYAFALKVAGKADSVSAAASV